MIRHIHVTAVFMLTISIEGTFVLTPPQDVKMNGSVLEWRPPDEDDVLYSLQYKPNRKSEDEWLNVSSHIGTKLKSFNFTPEFYGAVFRVRSEKENHFSEWQDSDPVLCVNVGSCAPITHLTVRPKMASLEMKFIDQSLEKEYGIHLKFNVIYWRKDNSGSPKVEFITEHKNINIELESGQNYCFQVKYLLYKEPQGNASEEVCEIIPETSEAIKNQNFLYCILTTLFVLAMCGICIFGLFKHHKKIKLYLQPLHLEIPDHYRQVLYEGFPLQACPSPSSQSLQSCDIIIVTENSDVEQNGQKEEQEQKSLT